METVTVARYEAGHALAVQAGEMLYGEKLARLHRTTAEEEAAAFAYLEKLGIHEALAFDSDFSHRFIMRPGPIK